MLGQRSILQRNKEMITRDELLTKFVYLYKHYYEAGNHAICNTLPNRQQYIYAKTANIGNRRKHNKTDQSTYVLNKHVDSGLLTSHWYMYKSYSPSESFFEEIQAIALEELGLSPTLPLELDLMHQAEHVERKAKELKDARKRLKNMKLKLEKIKK